MNVLYFKEPKLRYAFSGVYNVAYYLSRALAKNASVTYFPNSSLRKSYATKLLDIYRRLLIRDFDIVHFNVSPAWIQGGDILFQAAKLSAAPTVLMIHGIIQMEHLLYGTKKNKGLLKTLRYCKMANRVVTYSESMRYRIEKWYKVNNDKITVIPNGVDVEKFSECKSELVIDGDPAILYLGHLSKSVDLIIQAMSKIQFELPRSRLHLVGGGDADALKVLARKKRVETHVVFHGSVPSEKTPEYYKAADICVFPSRRDSAGLTLLEAMASGTPIIASRRGGTPEIINHGKDGILFDPDEVNALGNSILNLNRDKKLRKTISRNALKTVAKYNWDNIAKRYLSLYKDLREKGR
jgi:glycosyltransferase involved in cell wall biosynthesis